MKCYRMLQNARATAFTVSELLRKKRKGEGGVKLPPTQIRVNVKYLLFYRQIIMAHTAY